MWWGGLLASKDLYIAFDWGAVFLQASAGTNRQNYFTQARLTLSDPGLTFAVSRGASLDYEETSLSVSKQLGDGPVSLRAGYRLNAEEFFVGFSVNTF